MLGRPGDARHDYVQSTLSFPELDLEQMKKRLRLEKIAAERGAACLPASDSENYDDTERTIIAEIESEAKRCHEKFVNEINAYNDRLKSLGFHGLFAKISNISQAAQGDFKASVQDGSDQLYAAKKTIITVEKEIEEFKKQNNLQRIAYYPQSKIFHIGLLLIFVVIEGVLNGTFLAEGDILGLSGGIGKAVAIALVNVLFGVLVGLWIVTEVTHKSRARKFIGFAGTAVYLGSIFIFNLLVAHYRNALGGPDPEQAHFAAWQTFIADPVGLADVKSWFLFSIGMIFSIGSCIDGWFMDDRYPEYGRVDRKYKSAIQDYADLKQHLLDRLTDIRDRAATDIDRAQADIDGRRGQLDVIESNKAGFVEKYKNHTDYLEQCGNTLLSFYRDENRRNRPATCPPPKRFNDNWEIEIDIGDYESQRPFLNPGDLDQEIAEARKEAKEKQQELHTAYQQAVFEYQKIDQLTAKDIGDV